jgi:hypothetical protein
VGRQNSRFGHQHRHPQIVEIPCGALDEPVDLELALAQRLSQLDAGDHNGGVGKALEARHRAHP